jgi:fermentation-respiration switch protein FrsA (DUF1100 family)
MAKQPDPLTAGVSSTMHLSATTSDPWANAWRRTRVLRWLTVAYLAVLLLFMALEDSLLYFPAKYPTGDWQPAGLKFEDAWFNAPDGTRLHGWYVPAANPRAYVLFAHGNAGHLADRAYTARMLAQDLGVSVLMFDYRGYGRSEGSPNEAGILSDARAARAWLAERAKIQERDVVLMGESIGGAVVADLAADGARGLILENTFSSVPEVAAYHYPWLPIRLLVQSQFNSAEKIQRYHGPLLQCHGDADDIVPIQFGERLFEAANEPKQFVVIRGGHHNDGRRAEWLTAIEQFFGNLERQGASPPVNRRNA